MDVAFLGIRLALGAIFSIAGISKLLDPSGTKKSLAEFGASENLALIGSRILPVVELACAVALTIRQTAFLGAILSFGMLSAFIASIGYNLAIGRKPDCNCFGQLHSKPVGGSVLVRNILLMFIAAAVIVREGQAYGWSASQLTTGLFGLIVLALFAGMSWLLIQVLSQQATLMSTIKDLQESLEDVSLRVPVQRDDLALPEKGLPVGAPASDFALEDIDGNLVTLGDVRASGKSLVLLFLSQNCPPCSALAPRLEEWQARYSSELTMVAILRGTFDRKTSELGDLRLERILLEGQSKISARYLAKWTPAAIAIRIDGRIGHKVAFGPEEIATLVEHTAAPRNLNLNGHSQPEPSGGAGRASHGVHVGDVAPDFALPDLSGHEFRLTDNRGEELLLLFWNVKCSFCTAMFPEIRDWEMSRTNGAPKIVIVCSNSREEHETISLTCPILIDDAGMTFKAYGVSGTPSAVLVDKNGMIASSVCAGDFEVSALFGISPKAT